MAELTLVVCSTLGRVERIYVAVNTEGMTGPTPISDDEEEVEVVDEEWSSSVQRLALNTVPEVKLRCPDANLNLNPNPNPAPAPQGEAAGLHSSRGLCESL